MIRTLVILGIALVSVTGVLAQTSTTGPTALATPTASGLGVKAAASPWSLLDLSRIKWSNSYSVAFFSGGGRSGSVGMFNSSMLYEFSSKLALTVNLGVAHNPGAIWGNGNTDATFYPGFRLDYRPSSKVFMSLEVQRASGYYITPDGFRYYQPYGGFWFGE